VTKWDATGNLIWQFFSGTNVRPASIAVSGTGSVQVIGSFSGTFDADNDKDTDLTSSSAAFDLFWTAYGQN
jgi:hypothetical protein